MELLNVVDRVLRVGKRAVTKSRSFMVGRRRHDHLCINPAQCYIAWSDTCRDEAEADAATDVSSLLSCKTQALPEETMYSVNNLSLCFEKRWIKLKALSSIVDNCADRGVEDEALLGYEARSEAR